MPTLQEIRQQYPQYKDMSDADLAKGLHNKFYSDMDFGEFSKKIGFQDRPKADIGRTIFDQSMQGATFGFADEAQDRLGAAYAALATGEKYDDLLKEARAMSKKRMAEQWQDNPGTALASNLAGSIATGVAGAGTKAGAAVGNSIRSGDLAARIAKSGLAGAAAGGLAGAGSANEGNRVQGAAQGVLLGAGIGSALPVAGAGLSKLGDAAQGIAGSANRIKAAFGNEAAAASIGDDILAKRFIEEGFTPEQVKDLVNAARSTGMNPTLGEATRSSGVLQAEKGILRGTGKGANLMRQTLQERNRDAIPGALKGFADEVKQKAGDVSGKYQAASDEAAKMFYNANEAVANPSAAENITMNSVKGLDTARKSVARVGTAIDERLNQLGDVSNIESRALKQAQSIIQNAEKRGNTFDALLDAKKQLDNLYIEGADASVQKNASRYVSGFVKEINNALEGLAPNTYGPARNAAKASMAADDLMEAINNTNEGSIATLYNKFWAKPELRQDFLRMLPDDTSRARATELFSTLEKVKAGFGGSDTAFNIPANQQLSVEAGLGFNPNNLNPLESAPRLLERFGQYVQPKVYEQMAKQSLNPNVERISGAMAKQLTKRSPVNLPNGVVPSAGITVPTTQPKQMPPMTQAQADQPEQSSYYERLAQVESGNNPNAKAKTSSASGLYQFTNSTWKDMVKRYGADFGITTLDKNNPEAQRVMVEKFTQDNADRLSSILGREPSDGELYIAHFMGAGGAEKLLSAYGTGESAAKLFPKEAKANRSIFYSKMRPRTVEEVYDILTSKFA